VKLPVIRRLESATGRGEGSRPRNDEATNIARRHRFHHASLKSVAMACWNRAIELTIDNLIHQTGTIVPLPN
jgi:hypothetical protein